MQRRYDRFNPKRKLRKRVAEERAFFSDLAAAAGYGGNPEHKRNPGDFDLNPPSWPRPGKSLCDSAEIFSRRDALALLQSGLRRGMASERTLGRWPRNIWAVSDRGIPLEGQLENPETGVYHGYPMPVSDPLRVEILREWIIREDWDRQG